MFEEVGDELQVKHTHLRYSIVDETKSYAAHKCIDPTCSPEPDGTQHHREAVRWKQPSKPEGKRTEAHAGCTGLGWEHLRAENIGYRPQTDDVGAEANG